MSAGRGEVCKIISIHANLLCSQQAKHTKYIFGLTIRPEATCRLGMNTFISRPNGFVCTSIGELDV